MSGEQLAHPAARSMSLPFDVLLSGAASDIDDDGEEFVDDDEVDDADSDAAIAALSRRFSSDPNVVHTASRPHPLNQQHADVNRSAATKPSRRERVKALTVWYDRMSHRHRSGGTGKSFGGTTSAKNAIRADSWGYGAEDVLHLGGGLPDRRGELRKTDAVSVLQREVERLRYELTQERAKKMTLEQMTSSLQNALQFSKKKVNEQKDTISKLENEVRKARHAAPCLSEVLTVTERHFHAKEMALKRVIGGLSADRNSAVQMSERARWKLAESRRLTHASLAPSAHNDDLEPLDV